MHFHPGVPHRGPPLPVTVENAVRPKQPHVLAECPSMECQCIDQRCLASELCWVLGALSGERGTVHGDADTQHHPWRRRGVWALLDHTTMMWAGGVPAMTGVHGVLCLGWLPPVSSLDGVNRTRWDCLRGERYCNARGEILRPLQDPLQRRRSASACSSIKNVSVGSEDDQTPS